MIKIKMKTQEEVLFRLKELIQRSRKRYIKNHTKAKGSNCAFVVYDEDADQYRCTKCGTTDPDRCLNQEMFQPKRNREELAKDFAEEVKNPQILLREYRAEAGLLWTLGLLDPDDDETPVIDIDKSSPIESEGS